MFISKLGIYDKSEPLKHPGKDIPDNKVILLLVDAFREDFVEMNEDVYKYLNHE